MTGGAGLTVLLTNVRLDGRTGTETWLLDFALELQRQGHRPVVYTPRPGPIADALRLGTIPVIHDPRQLAEAPDVIHGHHTNPTLTALLAFPRTPALLFIHDWSAWHDRPARFPRIRRIVPVDETCADRALEAGFSDKEVEVVLNFVDLERFRPRPALPARPRRALLFDNDATPENHGGVIVEACRQAGIELDLVGRDAGRLTSRPEDLLPRYDLVFAKAKAALEAMATGCAVILVHRQGIGGLVTADRYDTMRRLNFGRRLLRDPLSVQGLAQHLDRYDAADATAVAGRIRAEASLSATAGRVLGLYHQVIDEQARSTTDPAAELAALGPYLHSIETEFDAIEFAGVLEQRRAELASLLTRAEADAAGLTAQLDAQAVQLKAVQAQLEAARLDAAGRAAAEQSAHEARLALLALRTSRRWRLVQTVLAPADAARRRGGARTVSPTAPPRP